MKEMSKRELAKQVNIIVEIESEMALITKGVEIMKAKIDSKAKSFIIRALDLQKAFIIEQRGVTSEDPQLSVR